MTPVCWHGDCDAELEAVDGAWQCPNGHRLRRYEDLTQRTRDRITYMQTDPGMLRRYFGDTR